MRKVLTLIFLVCLPFIVHAQFYKWVDENGSVHYSDSPGSGAAAKVKLPEIQSYSSPASRLKNIATTTATLDKNEDTFPGYTKLDIVSPEDEGTVWNTAGQINLVLALEPELQDKHKVIVLLDGKQYKTPFETTQIMLENVSRGMHTVRVKVIDESKKEMISSERIIVYLHRASSNFPNRQSKVEPKKLTPAKKVIEIAKKLIPRKKDSDGESEKT